MGQSDLNVVRGPHNPSDAEIVVIVMAVDTDRRAVAAVRSIIDQSVTAEIVLVNSGEGSFSGSLQPELLLRITLVESSHRSLPGATRNLGIVHSKAPIVAFLAADCIAQAGWLDGRLKAHREGHDLVASTVRPNADVRGIISSASWASYALIHLHRAPRTILPPKALSFGLSYRREVFQRHGMFDETVRVSEDLRLNRMLRDKGYRALWDRRIVTLHDYPSHLGAAVHDQFWRGRRSGQYARQGGDVGLKAQFRVSWGRHRNRTAAARVPRDDLPFDRPRTVMLIMQLLRGAFAVGVLSALVGRAPQPVASRRQPPHLPT